MENYDELIRSLEQHNDKPNYIIQKKAADAIEALREEVEEKQNLLNLAIADLAANNDCKYCANIDHCSPHQVERNLAYGSCIKWMWHGVKAAKKEVGLPSRKQ
jgi:hypothetical protein